MNTFLSKRKVLVGRVAAFRRAGSSQPRPLSSRQKTIIMGNILGDGHLQLSENGQSARLRFTHSENQADYVRWQYQQLGWLCEGVAEPRIIIERKDGREFELRRAYTKYAQELKPFHDLTYVTSTKPGRRFDKIVPANLSEFLTDPEMLMVWYLDDGTLRRDSSSIRLATQGFTLAEHQILENCLRENFDIGSTIENWPPGQHGLAIPSGQASKFAALFQETIVREIPSMMYKIDIFI